MWFRGYLVVVSALEGMGTKDSLMIYDLRWVTKNHNTTWPNSRKKEFLIYPFPPTVIDTLLFLQPLKESPIWLQSGVIFISLLSIDKSTDWMKKVGFLLRKS